MAPIAGWYDDPRDAGGLRYWDGSAWTEHVAPKQQVPTPAQWTYPGAPPPHEQTWQYGARQPPPWTGTAAPTKGPRTPDGVVITTWLKRLAARLLDGVFVFVIALPLNAYFIYRYAQALSDELNSTTAPSFLPSNEVLKWEISMALVLLAVQVVYEALSLRRWSATPGKRVVGISVRRLGSPGRLSWQVIGRRVAFIYGVGALSLVPLLSYLLVIVWLLDYLWPLWDKPRQALHDKFAGTVVVEGPAQVGEPAQP